MLGEPVITRVLEAGLRTGADFAEIFVEDRTSASGRLEDDRVEELTSHRSRVSVGAAGLMIRGGAPAEPVQEMTIASTLQRMLLDVTAVGSDLRWFGDSAGVTLAIADVSLGGL